MFCSQQAKDISVTIQQNQSTLYGLIRSAFANSIIGTRKEVDFLRNLKSEIVQLFNGSALVPGIQFTCRAEVTHQKPIVSSPFLRNSCELADLLIVINYKTSSTTHEAKSILYQVKLSHSPNSPYTCSINQTQLNLLSGWPPFAFGRSANGTYNQFTINPTSLEFGSYMLECRSAIPGQYTNANNKYYGSSPCALRVARELSGGSSSCNINLHFVLGDVPLFFNHLSFLAGEHHSSIPVANLIDAIYRYCNWQPDPPKEFEEFETVINDDGFGIIEITVGKG